MIAKQRAKQLVNLYLDNIPFADNSIQRAKQCALIAVDEIIKSKKLNYLFTQNQINSMESTSDDRWIHETFIEYWDKVKHEIEKL